MWQLLYNMFRVCADRMQIIPVLMTFLPRHWKTTRTATCCYVTYRSRRLKKRRQPTVTRRALLQRSLMTLTLLPQLPRITPAKSSAVLKWVLWTVRQNHHHTMLEFHSRLQPRQFSPCGLQTGGSGLPVTLLVSRHERNRKCTRICSRFVGRKYLPCSSTLHGIWCRCANQFVLVTLPRRVASSCDLYIAPSPSWCRDALHVGRMMRMNPT